MLNEISGLIFLSTIYALSGDFKSDKHDIFLKIYKLLIWVSYLYQFNIFYNLYFLKFIFFQKFLQF